MSSGWWWSDVRRSPEITVHHETAFFWLDRLTTISLLSTRQRSRLHSLTAGPPFVLYFLFAFFLTTFGEGPDIRSRANRPALNRVASLTTIYKNPIYPTPLPSRTTSPSLSPPSWSSTSSTSIISPSLSSSPLATSSQVLPSHGPSSLTRSRTSQEVCLSLSPSSDQFLTMSTHPGSNFFLLGTVYVRSRPSWPNLGADELYSPSDPAHGKHLSCEKHCRLCLCHAVGYSFSRLGFRSNFVTEVDESPQSLGFLLFRVLKRGSDSRFDEIRAHFFKFFGTHCFSPFLNTYPNALFFQDSGLVRTVSVTT